VSLLEALLVLLAGLGAGAINVLVGSGTLITFPTLLAVGYPPVVANVSNSVGLVPGSVAGAIGYRRELEGQGRRIVRLGAASVAGAALGAVLLLTMPDEAFAAVVPVFIAVALVLIVLQPRLARTIMAHRARAAEHGAALVVFVFLSSIYGGYFGAAQGIILLAAFGIALPDDIQRANALKNVLAGLVNLVAGLVFMAVADVAWEAVGLIAAGAVVGGALGARYGRRLPPVALRAIIVVVGLSAIAQLVL
jgi:uncharacterized membrane protein YfcA